MKWILLITLLFSVSVSAQYSKEYETYKKQYPNETLVRLLEEIVYTISIEDGEIKIRTDHFEEDLYLDKGATFNSKRSLSYSSFFDLVAIEASSLTFENNKYRENEVSEFNEKNDLDDSFYDDTKKVSFIYPNLQEGSKTKISYSYDIKNPRFLSSFYFGDYFPIVENKVTIIADKDVELTFQEFNTQGKNIQFEKKKKGKNHVYTWTLNHADRYEPDSDAPNYKNFLPHIIPIIKSYETKKEKKTVLDGVPSLYKWYYSLVENINQQETDEELKALVAQLIQGKTSDLEKVKAIYYWTQQNIKYIAFEYALGGFIPREANDVFKKKYGDCKDNSSILDEMLKIAGLDGHLTWIGTRSIPYTYEEVPTPAVDNHMILSYEDGNETYYLDATGRYIPIEYPSSFIQGKEALVSYGKDKFTVKKVPVMDADRSRLIDTTYLQIQENNVLGRSKVQISGYLKGDIFYELEDEKKQKDLQDFYTRKFQKTNNKFLIGSFTEENKYSYDHDFIVNYDFTIDGYIQRVGSEIFINPHLNQLASGFKTKKDRKRGVEHDYKHQFLYTYFIEIPEGYQVSYLPSNIDLNSDLLSVHLSYQQKGNQIVFQSKVSLNALVWKVEELNEVNNLIKKAQKAYKEIIILKKQ